MYGRCFVFPVKRLSLKKAALKKASINFWIWYQRLLSEIAIQKMKFKLASQIVDIRSIVKCMTQFCVKDISVLFETFKHAGLSNGQSIID